MKDRIDLEEVFSPPNYRAAATIVIAHGLFAHRRETWTSHPSTHVDASSDKKWVALENFMGLAPCISYVPKFIGLQKVDSQEVAFCPGVK